MSFWFLAFLSKRQILLVVPFGTVIFPSKYRDPNPGLHWIGLHWFKGQLCSQLPVRLHHITSLKSVKVREYLHNRNWQTQERCCQSLKRENAGFRLSQERQQSQPLFPMSFLQELHPLLWAHPSPSTFWEFFLT